MGTLSFGVDTTNGLLSPAWQVCGEAYKYGDEHSFTVKCIAPNFVLIAFPGAKDVEEISAESKFGECKINEGQVLFSSLKTTATDEAALVHKPSLARFLFLLEHTQFQNKVYEEGKKRRIVFTGHSVGGSVAVLATLWLLEQRCHSINEAPLCITFGSPLLGDDTFGQAIRRERWAAQFYHVISKYDIVPRLFLAPFKSIREQLKGLLPYWWRSMTKTSALLSGLEGESIELLTNVMQHASAVASYRSAMCMAPNNMLLGGISGVVKQSPYRPFGSYIFVFGCGAAAICTDNYDAVLQILYYTLQSPDPRLMAELCISEHTGYGSAVELVQNLMDIDTPHYDNLTVNHQLEALGLGTQNVEARLALQAAREAMKRLTNNKIKKTNELRNMKMMMDELETYKKVSRVTGIGYYDSFKQHADKRDFQANLARLRLAGFWDEIKDMLQRKELPDDFESEEEWIDAGNVYRMVVEPLDIANYYRLGKHEDTGHYLAKGRPCRYLLLQKWLEAHQLRSTTISKFGFTTDTCLWAYLEEISHTMAKTPQLSIDLKSNLQSFVKLVKTLIDNKQVCEDFFVEEGSFVKWWKSLPIVLKSESPLWEFMEGGGHNTYSTFTPPLY
ncbi:hypothetical protein KI387_005767 [Taxus chinensis]|uniref:Uncharacterized protein n=1 Tax=Taxus chinensis TaxID=29808 RepID=A0AA38GNG2_TAXCH|nr:hypothetical protein KI387_005767 [Taxus chinensis]